MDIIHIDEQIIVINKPAGLPILPDGWQPDAPYMLKMLEEKYGNPSTPARSALPGRAGSGRQVWVVHRLDKVTSGVMVFARTAESHRNLNGQFEQHEVEKVYQAIVEGVPPWDERTAKHMLQTNVGRKHRTVVVRKRGKKSETEFRVLNRGQVGALIEARPKTGRTHQIRVHLSALGFPILGDMMYDASETDLIARPALHAAELTFTHPGSGVRVTFTAHLQNDFLEALDRLKL